VVSCNNNAVADEFVVPDDEKLMNLGPGCFVRVAYESKNMWVEITAVEDKQFKGIMHPELDDESSTVAANTLAQVPVKHINALGCDRYCYCD
jgi:hypothetical protein